MWILAGRHNSTRYNDVWCSSNGVDWTEVTGAASWEARYHPLTLVHDDKLWLLGGLSDSAQFLNDVWYSENGANWNQATNEAPWPGRYNAWGYSHDDTTPAFLQLPGAATAGKARVIECTRF